MKKERVLRSEPRPRFMDLLEKRREESGLPKGRPLVTKKELKRFLSLPPKAKDQPATRRMLDETRKELKSDIQALSLKMDGRFNEVDGRFKAIDGRFDEIDGRFKAIDGRFDEIDHRFEALTLQMQSEFAKMDARMSRMQVLIEEQNANNNIVLEGIRALWQRQDRIEARLP